MSDDTPIAPEKLLAHSAWVQALARQLVEKRQEPVDDLSERLQAIIRLYTDTPEDMRTRCQRLTAWLAKIDAALQQDGQQPLTAHIATPQI